MSVKSWLSDKIAEFVMTGLLGAAWAVVLAFLKLHRSVWAAPLLYATAGAFMLWIGGVAWIAASRIPKLRTKVTSRNIEGYVRNWLDNSGSAVKSVPVPEAFFRFEAKLPGGTKVLVGRPRVGLTEHVLIRADIVNDKNIPRELKEASQKDQERLQELIKLELARAKVGYFGLNLPVDRQFSVQTNVRITDYLNEETFMRAVWNIEAALHAVNAVYSLWLKQLAKR